MPSIPRLDRVALQPFSRKIAMLRTPAKATHAASGTRYQAATVWAATDAVPDRGNCHEDVLVECIVFEGPLV
jgi:hypothetical protein